MKEHSSFSKSKLSRKETKPVRRESREVMSELVRVGEHAYDQPLNRVVFRRSTPQSAYPSGPASAIDSAVTNTTKYFGTLNGAGEKSLSCES